MFLTCGVDEAGRGALLGDVYAAAVILNPDRPINGLKDSKMLTAMQREKLYDEITSKALSFAVASSSVLEINSLNILQATLLAMKRSVEQLAIIPNIALIDGNQAPNLKIQCRTIVQGDKTVPEISAASIIAKVTRDMVMRDLDKKYPGYGLSKHKGYGTKEHIKAIEKLGVLDIHRKNFAPIKFKFL